MLRFRKARRLASLILWGVAVLSLVGAASVRAAQDQPAPSTAPAKKTLTIVEVETLYGKGLDALRREKYREALDLFGQVKASGVSLGSVRDKKMAELTAQAADAWHAQEAVRLAADQKTRAEAAKQLAEIKNEAALPEKLQKDVAAARATLGAPAASAKTPETPKAAPPAEEKPDPETVARLETRSRKLQGDYYADHGQLDRAMECYREAEKNQKLLPPAEQDELRNAIADTGLRMNQKRAGEAFEKGETLLAAGKRQEALDAFKAAQKDAQYLSETQKRKLGDYVSTLPALIAAAAVQPPAAVPAKPEAPKAAPPKTEPVKAEAPKAAPPATEPAKPEAPKVAPPKTEPVKAEAPKATPPATEPAKPAPGAPAAAPVPAKPSPEQEARDKAAADFAAARDLVNQRKYEEALKAFDALAAKENLLEPDQQRLVGMYRQSLPIHMRAAKISARYAQAEELVHAGKKPEALKAFQEIDKDPSRSLLPEDQSAGLAAYLKNLPGQIEAEKEPAKELVAVKTNLELAKLAMQRNDVAGVEEQLQAGRANVKLLSASDKAKWDALENYAAQEMKNGKAALSKAQAAAQQKNYPEAEAELAKVLAGGADLGAVTVEARKLSEQIAAEKKTAAEKQAAAARIAAAGAAADALLKQGRKAEALEAYKKLAADKEFGLLPQEAQDAAKKQIAELPKQIQAEQEAAEKLVAVKTQLEVASRAAMDKDYGRAEEALAKGKADVQLLSQTDQARWAALDAQVAAEMKQARAALEAAKAAAKDKKYPEARAALAGMLGSGMLFGAVTLEAQALDAQAAAAQAALAEEARQKQEAEQKRIAAEKAAAAEEARRKQEAEQKRIAAEKAAAAALMADMAKASAAGDYARVQSLGAELKKHEAVLTDAQKADAAARVQDADKRLGEALARFDAADKAYQARQYADAKALYAALVASGVALGAEKDKLAQDRLAGIDKLIYQEQLDSARKAAEELKAREAKKAELERQIQERKTLEAELKQTLADADKAYLAGDFVKAKALIEKTADLRAKVQPVTDQTLATSLMLADARMKEIDPKVKDQIAREEQKAKDLAAANAAVGRAETEAKALKIEAAQAALDEAAALSAKHPGADPELARKIAAAGAVIAEQAGIRNQKLAGTREQVAALRMEIEDHRLAEAEKLLGGIKADAAIFPPALADEVAALEKRLSDGLAISKNLAGEVAQAEMEMGAKKYDAALDRVNRILASAADLGPQADKLVEMKARAELKTASERRMAADAAERAQRLMLVAEKYATEGNYVEAGAVLKTIPAADVAAVPAAAERLAKLNKEIGPLAEKQGAALAEARKAVGEAIKAQEAGDVAKALSLFSDARKNIVQENVPVDAATLLEIDQQIGKLSAGPIRKKFDAQRAEIESGVQKVVKAAQARRRLEQAQALKAAGAAMAAKTLAAGIEQNALDADRQKALAALADGLDAQAKAAEDQRLLRLAPQHQQLIALLDEFEALVKAGKAAEARQVETKAEQIKGDIAVETASDMMRRGNYGGAFETLAGVKTVSPVSERTLKDLQASLADYTAARANVTRADEAIARLDLPAAQNYAAAIQGGRLGELAGARESLMATIEALKPLSASWQTVALDEADALSKAGSVDALAECAGQKWLTEQTKTRIAALQQRLAGELAARRKRAESTAATQTALAALRQARGLCAAGKNAEALAALADVKSADLSAAAAFEQSTLKAYAQDQVAAARARSERGLADVKNNIELAQTAVAQKRYADASQFLSRALSAEADVPDDLAAQYAKVDVAVYNAEQEAGKLYRAAVRAMQANDKKAVREIIGKLKSEFAGTRTYSAHQ